MSRSRTSDLSGGYSLRRRAVAVAGNWTRLRRRPTGGPTGTPAEALDCACQLPLAAPGI